MNRFSNYPPTLDGVSVEEKRKEIREYFHNTFNIFEKIFEVLKEDAVFYKKSEPTRHPMIFYFGHTAVFFINKLIGANILQKRINPEYESIFAIGVDEMDWDDMRDNSYQWPRVSEVRAYRNQVRACVDNLITQMAFALPIDASDPMWIVLMGIEHERIHIETSLVLHRQMPLDFVKEVEEFLCTQESGAAVENALVCIEASNVKLGKEKSHNLYGWDNEYGFYEEKVESFDVAQYLVSNAEFMPFVQEGGYENEAFWDEEGKKFLHITSAKHPRFWVLKEGVYQYRTLASLRDMPQNWPVEVNALEAEAFCRYKSKKENLSYQLPSEAQYRVLYESVGLDEVLDLDAKNANQNLINICSSPVNKYLFQGIGDVVGNVWQWSRTAFFGFDGFEVHPAYDDFSSPTFDGKHNIITGSSWASSGNLLMKHSRYAFRKHFHQNAGFRYVLSDAAQTQTKDIYESDELVSQYCEFQYGDTHFGVANFAIECVKIAAKYTNNYAKALDLGCATGRATFELARHFEVVEGVDFSVRFIQVGSKLKSEGYVAFSSKEEGELLSYKKVTSATLGYDLLREKVLFWQGDACNLKPNFTGYDLIMATNLIDRLYAPMLFLENIDTRLNKDGVLILTSPYTWQESSTKKELWLGGYIDEAGHEIKTIERLQKVLGAKFELLHLQDLAFVIKESARKYQHTISQVSVWQKK
ncbi:MAG TPA: SAM-dependent methyltransferase [Sulfurimonas sp. UBA12504]|nr:MAG: SAM-dependent methyltransferase [Sulfurimonas sp. GWF2_37_8]DAB29854.1 MAG TPA: SAM-dependent methyltransferase [Sulfurimonas sp. UBA12504]